MFKKLLCLGSFAFFASVCAADTFSSQAIEIDSSLYPFDGNLSYWMIVRDQDTGAVTPYFLTISTPDVLHLFKINSNHYTIIDLSIQYHGGTIRPCALDYRIVDDKATRVILRGLVTDEGPHIACQLTYVLALPINQMTATIPRATTAVSSMAQITAPTSAQSSSTTPGESNQYSPVVNYLTNLKSCKAGAFKANINKQNITYTVRGRSGVNCLVNINIAGVTSTPILCKFTPQQIAHLTSEDQMNMYRTGKLDIDANSEVTQIMNSSCK